MRWLTEAEELDMFHQIILEDGINLLSTKQRTVLGLILNGYKQAEVARLLHISRSSVGDCYRKCIATLRSFLEEDSTSA